MREGDMIVESGHGRAQRIRRAHHRGARRRIEDGECIEHGGEHLLLHQSYHGVFIRDFVQMIRVTRSKMDYTTRNNVRNNTSVYVFLGVLFAKEQSSGGTQHVAASPHYVVMFVLCSFQQRERVDGQSRKCLGFVVNNQSTLICIFYLDRKSVV